MAKSIVVLGTQWGDEGKGKIVDLLTDQANVVARFQADTMLATPLLLMVRRRSFISCLPVYCVKALNA